MGGKTPVKDAMVHHPDHPWDQSTQMLEVLASLCMNCPWVKEAVSLSFTPTLLLLIAGDTQS